MSRYRALEIGELKAAYPIIQGGMGVGISLSSLAGNVAKAGGIGLISTAQIGFREPDFYQNPKAANLRSMKTEMEKARSIAPDGIIGFNIMSVTRDYPDYVKTAVAIGADIIVSGAGLPIKLPEYTAQSKVKIAPIVSSPKSALVICKMWDRKYARVPDFLIVEGPLAGGHLGFSLEELVRFHADSAKIHAFAQNQYDQEILGILQIAREYGKKYRQYIPVISAGGIFSREDMEHHMALGADGVQLGTRFVTTQECDAPPAYKEAYLKAEEKDIVLVKSPVGMPGRAIFNSFLKKIQESPEKITHCFHCLEHCNPASAPYCITMALIRAAQGQIEDALLFCGSNAAQCRKIERVEQVIKDLCES